MGTLILGLVLGFFCVVGLHVSIVWTFDNFWTGVTKFNLLRFNVDDWWYKTKWQLIAKACDQKWIPKTLVQFVLTRVS